MLIRIGCFGVAGLTTIRYTDFIVMNELLALSVIPVEQKEEEIVSCGVS